MVFPMCASLAIPKLMSARLEANQRAAVATMRSIASGEAVFQNTGVLDLDRDGAGEYGTLAELSGQLPLRGSKEVLEPEILPFRNIKDGIVTRSGYHFAVFLPGKKKGTFVEPKSQDGSDVNANEAEISFIVQAWPVDAPETGRCVYCFDQEGDLVCCENPGCTYSGLEHRLAFDAYRPADPSVDPASGKPYVGRDGKTWVLVPDPRR